MSTIKSSAENLTLNADGSGNDIIIQSNAATKAIVTAEGNVGVGTNTPLMASTAYNGLHVNATYPTVKLSANATGHAATDGFHLRIDSTPRVEYWNYENTDQVFANNNGEKLRLLAGGGITFNGDTAAANALDDYEEGVHTVTATDSGGGATYGLNSGYDTFAYTKIGRLVTITGTLVCSTVSGTASGQIKLTLPFACVDTTEQGGRSGGAGIAFYQIQKYTSGDYAQHNIAEGTSFVSLLYGSVGGNAYDTKFNTSSQVYCNFSYFTA